MTTIQQLISQLYTADIKLALRDGKLQVNAPHGALTPTLRAELSARKAELLTFLAQQQTSQPIPQRTDQSPAPLSFAQQRLWFLEQLGTTGTTYHLVTLLQLTGDLQIALLEASLSAIVARHAILRTTYTTVDGEPQQTINAPQPVTLETIDLRTSPPDAQMDEVKQVTAALQAKPFDLAQGPLWRFQLFRLSPTTSAQNATGADEMSADERSAAGQPRWMMAIVMHHLITDEWSTSVLVQEVSAFYHSMITGDEAMLPDLPIQYADYATWQRAQAETATWQRQLDQMIAHLRDATPLLQLPTDHERPAAPSLAAAAHSFSLPATLSAQLKAFAQANNSTLYTLYLTAFALLLSRYSRQHDFIVGSPVANRERQELEPLIGFLVNTLALRMEIDPKQSFRTLLRKTRQQVLDAFANINIPFEQLVDALQPVRQLNHNPLFQVMFVWQHGLRETLELPGLAVDLVAAPPTNIPVDLLLTMHEDAHADGGAIRGQLLYSTDLFRATTAAMLVDHLLQLLANVVAQPDAPLHTLPCLTPTTRAAVLTAGTGIPQSTPPDQPLHALVEAQVARTPDAPAIYYQAEAMSYAELNARANQLAHALLAEGHGAGHRIAICAERSPDMIIAVLAVMKIGAAYVPLDPDYPAERLAYMLKDAAVAAILAQTAVANCLPLDDVEVRVPTFWLDRFDCRSFPTTNTEQPVEPTAQLYQIYTSGSTGHPKGVVVSHRGVANTIGALADQTAISPGDRLFQFVPFGFDPAAIDFFATLSRGAALVLHPQPTRLSADELLAFCSANGVTIVNFTVALWQQWVDNLHLQGRTFPSALRVFLTGGDKPGAQTLRTWATLGDHTMLYCCSYGPTEASITTTFYTITNEQVRREPPPFIPLGPALPNVAIYLLDEHQQLVPPGTPGEIYIGGAGVADGYWQRPDLTPERFVELPAFDNPTTTLRLYRTGDLARWLFAADGRSMLCEFIGRVDTQVKIRGFRIELGEIETQLRRLPSVREAVVIATESMTGHGAAEKQLAAYVQLVEQPAAPQLSSSDDAVTGEPHRSSPRVPWYHPPEQDDERISGRGGGWEGVISQLRVHLPLHMIPTAWTHMDAWPMTPNGKIDRAALPTPDFTTATESYVAPTSPLEAEIAAIWARLLGRERVGITSDFFAIGGHSLLATQVVAHIQQQLNRQVPLRTLFEAPTIAQLAAAITDTAHVDMRPPLVSVDRAMPLPLSFAQQRLWLLHQLHPESSGYNIPAALQLTGDLNLAALQQALDALVARHESLRTTFVTINGEPMQQIAATGSLPLHHVDLRHLPNDERPPAAEAQAAILAQDPFDLATEPLVRAYLFTLTDDSAILFVLMHHIITDGWSIPILVAELSAYYSAAVAQRAPTLAPLPLQYADYAHWQRQWLRDGVLQDQLTYWRQQLAGAPTLLALPTDRPRPAQPTFAAGTLTFAIDPATVAALRALAQQHGATLFMAFAATLGVLLSRYSQQRDLLIGMPIANRTHPALDKLIGFFVNTLALRFDLSEPLSFAALLDQVRQTTLDAYAHQDAPFDQVIDTLALPRDLSHAPLFQVLLAWQSATGNGQDVDLPGLSLAPVAWNKPTLEVDLALSVAEEEVQGAEAQGATELAVTWQYSTDLFERERMAEMVASFQTLLSAVVSTPAEPVASLPLYPAATLSRLLAAGVGPVQPEITAHCLHHQFEAVVAAQPQAPALLFSHHAISYAELNARANQLAHALAAHGYGPGDRIAICLERSPQLVIAILAVLKCGAAYLPLDPAYPHDRLSYILQDAAAATLITTRLLATERFTVSETAAAAPNMLLLDALDVSTFPIANPTVTVTPSAPFYQIYTSGSTGQPKGVLVAHQGVANTITATVTQAEIRVGDRLLQFVPVGFDAAAIDLFAPLTTGGVIVIHPHPTRLAAHELLAFCRQEGVTVLNQSTAAWQQLVNNMVVQGLRFPPTVRVFLTGGEKPAVAALHTWATLGNHPMRYVSSYGPTEASISASIYTITSDEVRATSPSLIPLGEPLPNVSLLLLDAAQQPVPDGAPGEIYIGGIGVHNEYWQRPTQTAAGYVELPWVTTAAGQQMERYYRTGDLARRRQTPAGTLFEFVGRVDTQVKIRGFRIELGEIETQINQLPQVRTAIVLAQEHGTGDKRLVAYVQLVAGEGDLSAASADSRPATGDEAAALAAQLREQLPEHMIPAAWLIMATWPLTAHGKVDRNALPTPTFASPAATYVAPQGPLESALAAIWQEVLGLEQVGVSANFFALGGHSLLATQVVARIQQQLGVAVPLRTLFAQPTIRQLAKVVAAAQPAANRPPIVRVDRDAPLSLSFAQQRLWLMQQLTPDSGFFNMPAALRLTGELRLDALQAAFDDMLARHESLRTYFPQVNGTPVQQIGASTISIAHYPHSHPPTGDAAEWSEAKLIAWVTELAEAPFDLETGPLLRVALLRLHANQHLLLIVMHHIIGDDWSRRIFMQEFSELYRAQITGEAADLPALMIQYADFAAWQRQWLQGDLLQQQLDYWRTQLAAAPPLLELPTDHPRPPQQRFVGERLTVTLNAALSAALRTFSREQQSTLQMTLLTGFAALLARYSGMDDLVIGIPVAGRTDQQVEELIGFFLNTLALRIRLSTELDFTALLAQVRQVTLDAYANQDAPFERVIEVVNPTPQLSHTPIFQVMFDLAQADEHDLELPGLHVEALDFDTSSAKFDLHLVFSESADEQAGLTAVWEYNSDIFARSTIEQMARHLEQLYRVALQAPTRPLTQLPLLTAAERGVALQRWNQTTRPIPADACMQELFEAQVARTPHARAARCGEETLTYAELNARSNRWAKQLVALGVGPDVIVTPFWARDLDYLTAILAIFKAGGAYQPLDPALPSKRLTQILEQSRSPLILTKRAFLPLVESALAALPTAQRPQCMLVDDLDAVTLPVDNLPRRNQPDNLAYVIFTSGSTGVPKGVMVEQRGLVNHLCAMQHNLALGATDIIGQSATQSYVISVWQFLAALTVGATVEIIPAETMLDPVALLDTLEAREVSVVQVVPSLLRLLLEALEMYRVPSSPTSDAKLHGGPCANGMNDPQPLPLSADAGAQQQLPNVRWMIPTGEALPPALARRWFAVCPHIPLLNAYGSSECSDDVAHDRITQPPAENVVTMPIGQPIPNVQMYVLDSNLEPVPAGVAGELYVGGLGVGRGYLHDAARTARSFLPNPFQPDPTARLYKTGDRVRRLADGTVEYLGRFDFQVKVRGVRIELGEIEATLGHHPAVAQTVVMVHGKEGAHDVGQTQLVAYVVPKRAATVTPSQLRQFLAEQLPDYMVPAAILLLPDFPRNASGKVARALLPSPTQLLTGDSQPYIAPRNDIEVEIVDILAEVTGIDAKTIGVHHNFFDLGGHSMQAIQIVWQLHDRFGVELPLRSIFEQTTVESLANLVIDGQLAQIDDETIEALLAEVEHTA